MSNKTEMCVAKRRCVFSKFDAGERGSHGLLCDLSGLSRVLAGKKQNLTAKDTPGFAEFAEEITIGWQIEMVSANHRRSPQL